MSGNKNYIIYAEGENDAVSIVWIEYNLHDILNSRGL